MRLLIAIGCIAALLSGASHAEQVYTTAPHDPTQAPVLRPLPPPSLNFYGAPGLIDMPSGEMMPEGQFSQTISYFGGQGRINLAFQPTEWLSATFRYIGIRDLNLFGFSTYYDRGFDVRFRLFKEKRRFPSIVVGLQDFAGTGVYAGEYIVATKTFETPPVLGSRLPGRLKLTGGLGWGRLGTHGGFGGIGTRPNFVGGDTGGELSYDQWFRGPIAPFGGIEWLATDKLGFKLEYSSDAYELETQSSSVFERKSSFNFGVEYQATPRTRVGAYYLYGSEFGISAQIQLSPYFPQAEPVTPAPYPVQARPSRNTNPEAWATTWTASAGAPATLRDELAPVLENDGLLLEALDVSAHSAELRFRNQRYRSNAVAVGRAARWMARILPASIETFRLVPVVRSMPLSTVVIRRSDLEALEHTPNNSQALLAVAGFEDAKPLSSRAVEGKDLYPDFSWSVSPYFTPGYFDPDQPFRIDAGVEVGGTYQPAPGWVLSGRVRQRIAGNLADGRLAPSNLPPVRTDQVLYAQYDTTLNQLYLARYWRPGRDLYARVTGGYFEYGYGGLSTEVLWKPVSSQLALGVEANYAIKRDYDQRLGFQDYKVFTGHASAYLDMNNGFTAQVDMGRYLAGDYGATVSLDRVFNNGWSVGGFFTLTNVSAEDFGEGSFDKGIRFSIPVRWFLGKPSRKSMGTVIRPIQRDGGARVSVPGRLYGPVRNAHRKALSDQWTRFWE